MPHDYKPEWLVSAPANKTLTTALTEACRGSEKLANLLNYFLYEAAREVKRLNIDKETVDFIELDRSLDDIIRALAKHNKAASKKTIHDRVIGLQVLEYIESSGYQQKYKIFFKKVAAALVSPPEIEKPKLRGRHVRRAALQAGLQPLEDGNFNFQVKSTIPTSEIEALQNEIDALKKQVTSLATALEAVLGDNEDGNFNLKVKSTISTEKLAEEMVILREEMSNLTFEKSNLTFEKSNLTSQMSNLTSSLSHEQACRAALEAKFEALYSYIHSNTITNTLLSGDTSPVAANALNIFELPQKEKVTKRKTVTPSSKQENLIDPKEIIFTEEEDRIYTYWCNLESNNGYKQKKSESMKGHFNRLAPVIASQEDMQALYNHARALPFNAGKGIYPGTLANAYPGWRSTVVSTQQNKPAGSPSLEEEENRLIIFSETPFKEKDAKNNWFMFRWMKVSEARKYGFDESRWELTSSLGKQIANLLNQRAAEIPTLKAQYTDRALVSA